jgi:hypothetical protein
VLEQRRSEKLRVIVVWEPVLPTDWLSPTPTTATMRRVSDLRVHQYWDRGRLLSKAMGEGDRRSVVWDWVGVYAPEAIWESRPPKPAFGAGPVVRVVPAFTNALAEEFKPER